MLAAGSFQDTPSLKSTRWLLFDIKVEQCLTFCLVAQAGWMKQTKKALHAAKPFPEDRNLPGALQARKHRMDLSPKHLQQDSTADEHCIPEPGVNSGKRGSRTLGAHGTQRSCSRSKSRGASRPMRKAARRTQAANTWPGFDAEHFSAMEMLMSRTMYPAACCKQL